MVASYHGGSLSVGFQDGLSYSTASCSGDSFKGEQFWVDSFTASHYLWDHHKLKSKPCKHRSALHTCQRPTRVNAWYDTSRTSTLVSEEQFTKEETGGTENLDPLEAPMAFALSTVPGEEMYVPDVQLEYDSDWETLSVEEVLERMPDLALKEDLLAKCICVLQKGKRSGNKSYAIQIYIHICANGFDSRRVLGSYLIAMFVECGSLHYAKQVFDKLSYANQYAWTYLIQGYLLYGDPQYALYLLLQMRQAGILYSKYTFVAALDACTRLKLVDRGQELHTQAVIEGLEKNLSIGRALVHFYSKCNLCAEASEVFDNLAVHDTLSWTAEHNKFHYEKESPDQMDDTQANGVPPTIATFIYSLKACASMRDLNRGRGLHSEIIKQAFDGSLYVGNTLVDMYAKCGSMTEARKVLEILPIRDVVSWTALITGYVNNALGADALKCLDQLRFDGVAPNTFTYVSFLKACGSIRAAERGIELHSDITKEGLDLDPVVCNSLVDIYARCGLLAEAQDVFDKLALRDIISWTSLISGYAEWGSPERALQCTYQMQLEGLSPNVATFACCLNACGHLKVLTVGYTLHADMLARGFESPIILGNALVDMYAKCGSIVEAIAIFNRLLGRDVVSWTTLISGYLQHGLYEQALDCLDEMQQDGLCPNAVTFSYCLKACGSLGDIDVARKLHEEVIKRGFDKNTFVRNALVDTYVECGKLFDV